MIISAHALIRWLERVNGLNLAPYRATIRECGGDVTDGAVLNLVEHDIGDAQLVAARAAMTAPWIVTSVALGARSLTVGDVTLIIKNATVITVKPRHATHATKRTTRDWRASRMDAQLEDAE